MQQFEEQDDEEQEDDFLSFHGELVLPPDRPVQEQQAVAPAPAPVQPAPAAAAVAVVPQPALGYVPYFISYCSVS